MSATTSTTSAPTENDRTTPQLKQVRASGSWVGKFATELSVRRFPTFVTGEPIAVGGDNCGPTPMEYVVAALNGCLAVTIETVAAEQGVRFEALDLQSEATMDTRGFAGTADVSPYFLDLTSRARFVADGGDGFVPALQHEVERRCPALNLIKDAGVPVVLDWTVEEPAR
jgi:Predicted redox protein, regulator of disulfide bond formation